MRQSQGINMSKTHNMYYSTRRHVQSHDAIAQRRKREIEETWALRKISRREIVNKRRNITHYELIDDALELELIGKPADYQDYLNSEDKYEQLNAVISLRKLLSLTKAPPIQEAIDLGYLPRLIEFADQVSNPNLQFEALWVLTNIASGNSEQTETVVSAGLAEVALKHLNATNEDVKNQAVWALSNIVGDGPDLRDRVIELGGLSPILSLCQDLTCKIAIRRTASWCMKNFCRIKSRAPDFDRVKDCLPVIKDLLLCDDDALLSDASRALSFLSDTTAERLQVVIDSGVISGRLIELCESTVITILWPVLHTLGNVITGNDIQTQHVLDLNLLPKLVKLLDHEKRSIVKDVCWIVSNINAGTEVLILMEESRKLQIEAVLSEPQLMSKVAKNADVAEFKVKKEALWAITNATSNGTRGQIIVLVEKFKCLPILCQSLHLEDKEIVHVCLRGISNMLWASEKKYRGQNKCAAFVEQEGDALDVIQSLCSDENDKVAEKASIIIDAYFDNSRHDDNEDVQYSDGK